MVRFWIAGLIVVASVAGASRAQTTPDFIALTPTIDFSHAGYRGGGVAAPQRAEQEGRGGHPDDHRGQQAAHPVDLAQEGSGQAANVGQHFVDFSQFAGVAGGHDDAAGLTVNDQGAGKGHAITVAKRRIHRGRRSPFFDR